MSSADTGTGQIGVNSVWGQPMFKTNRNRRPVWGEVNPAPEKKKSTRNRSGRKNENDTVLNFNSWEQGVWLMFFLRCYVLIWSFWDYIFFESVWAWVQRQIWPLAMYIEFLREQDANFVGSILWIYPDWPTPDTWAYTVLDRISITSNNI